MEGRKELYESSDVNQNLSRNKLNILFYLVKHCENSVPRGLVNVSQVEVQL